MTLILETERLMLRKMNLDDLDFIAELLANTDVMRFYPKCYTRDEAANWIQRQIDRYARDGHGLWLVNDKRTQLPVGQVGLVMQTVDGIAEPEIGYLIHQPFWRQGFASEAAAATRDYAFKTLKKQRVISLIRPINLPSQGVARKIGMLREPRTVMHGGFEHWVFAASPSER